MEILKKKINTFFFFNDRLNISLKDKGLAKGIAKNNTSLLQIKVRLLISALWFKEQHINWA